MTFITLKFITVLVLDILDQDLHHLLATITIVSLGTQKCLTKIGYMMKTHCGTEMVAYLEIDAARDMGCHGFIVISISERFEILWY